MSLAARKLGSGLLLLWLWLASGSPCLDGLEPSHIATLNLTPSNSEVSLAAGAEAMCDPPGDMPLAAAQAGVFGALANEQATSDRCHGYWVRMNIQATSLPPGGWVLQLTR